MDKIVRIVIKFHLSSNYAGLVIQSDVIGVNNDILCITVQPATRCSRYFVQLALISVTRH